MDATQLKDIFKSDFQLHTWEKVIFPQLFRKVDFFTEHLHLFSDTETNGFAGYQLGLATLDDGKKLALFVVSVAEKTTIVSNRVTLRNIAAHYIDQHIVHGALVLYHRAEKKDYRFTFISKYAAFDEDGQFNKNETNPKRFTYVLGENESCTTAAKRFEVLFQKHKSLIINDFIEAFSVEKLSKDFFKDYRNKHYSDFIAFLTGENADSKSVQTPHESLKTVFNNDKKAARDFVKKLLGRLVFMHFLQKKGWLGVPKTEMEWQNGDPAFLQNLFKNFEDKAHFLTQCLNPLFFNTLNADRKSSNDLFPLTDSRIPYLNGGLFDADKLQTQWIDFPALYFTTLFDFFDQYNFTIDENDPDEAEIGIDPEMLGHIFENLLEDNKDKGAFYTPKEIVQYMCQESLIQYLNTHLENYNVKKIDNEAIVQLVRYKKLLPVFENKEAARQVENLLKSVKICDPAIGSGAFPIGLLQTIYQTRLHLFPKLRLGTAFVPAHIKKEIIQHSIYGVDKDGGAVDIARLRFWLALIVDENQPEPLPNLDFKIMQGDSLLESFDGIALDKIALPKATQVSIKIVNPQIDIFGNIQNGQTAFFTHDIEQTDIQQLLKDYFIATSATKPALHKQIDKYVLENIHYNLEMHSDTLKIRFASDEKRFKDKLNIIKQEAQKQKLLESKEAIALNKLKAKLAEKDAQFDILKKMHKSAERPFFLWHTYFKEVFDNGGFDIVIGNPPYVAIQRMKAQDKEALLQAKFDTFENTGDLYALFYEKGLELLKKRGILAYITSRQWMQAGYGKSLRRFLVEKTNPLQLVDFGQNKLFEGATVFVNILMFAKAPNTKQLRASLIPTGHALHDNGLETFIQHNQFEINHLDENTWKISDTQSINQLIEARGKPLKDFKEINFYRGVTSGLNEAFHISETEKQQLIEQDAKNEAIIKPLLRGKDIKRYGYEFANMYFITFFPNKKIDIQHYPTLLNFMLANKEKLEPKPIDFEGVWGGRKAGRYKWYETQDDAAYWQRFEEPKIVWIEISDRANYAYDTNGMYLTNSAYFLTCESDKFRLKYLLAVLNSKVSDYYFAQHTAKIAGGRMRYTGQYVGLVRIPELDLAAQKPFEILVDYILALKKRNWSDSQARMMPFYFEHLIDVAVYELFFETAMHAAGFSILKHLQDLPFFEVNPTVEAIQKVYERLHAVHHPIRQAIEQLKNYEPFSIIEASFQRKIES